MKKLLVYLFLAVFASFSTFANDADLFNLDYNAVQTEFSGLNQLSEMVANNPDLTYSALKLSDEYLVTSLMLVPDVAITFDLTGEPLLGIPSFLWGCAFGPLGMIVVYIGTDEDKEETKKALWGCVTSTLVYGVIYVFYVVLFVTAASTI